MKPDEAHTLAAFLKASFPSLTDEQLDVYESSLLYEDATLASKAILEGIREWKFPPRYAEIVERIRSLRRAATPPPEEEVVFARELPFWVKRWVVARYLADPRDERPFKEQYEMPYMEKPTTGWMPDDAWVEEAKRLSDESAWRMVRRS